MFLDIKVVGWPKVLDLRSSSKRREWVQIPFLINYVVAFINVNSLISSIHDQPCFDMFEYICYVKVVEQSKALDSSCSSRKREGDLISIILYVSRNVLIPRFSCGRRC